MSNIFLQDYLFDNSRWTGSFSFANRIMKIAAGNSVFRNVAQMSDGEVDFEARITPTDATAQYGMNFLFRSQSLLNASNCYSASVQKKTDPYTGNINANKFIQCQIRNASTGFGDKVIFESGKVQSPTLQPANNLLFDLPNWQHYKVLFSKGWISVFIDGILVLDWYDNNTQVTYSTGYFGFGAQANTTLEVRNVVGTVFFQQVNKFSINPGDDFDTAIRTLTDTIRAWNFSDLFGRFKSVVLYAGDVANYTYQNQLWTQSTDESDKEFVNQVTVIGLNVSAIARDNTSIGSTGAVRDEVIVDYKITTLKDAQDRAAYELVNFNKFNAQSDPKVANNVGSEVFDVVQIINTDSNLNQSIRIYQQRAGMDGTSNNYTLEMGTGKVS